MNKLAIFVIVMFAIGAYFYRDQLALKLSKNNPAQIIYTWKDKDGKVHYSGNKTAAPAHTKPADLPGLSIIETDHAEMEKQATRLKEKENPPESGVDKPPKMPEVRNLALERMEKAFDKAKQ